MHTLHRVMILVLLITCSVFLMGCPPRALVSTAQEVEIGREASQEIERRYRVDTDPQRNALVTQMGQELVQYSDRQDITYTFKILDTDDVNAFALPGGWIYIFRGLMDQTADQPDQLAGVIAHEIGHVAARHHAELIGRQFYAQVIVGTLTRGDIQRIATIFANLQLLQWSRRHELESDRLAIDYTFQSTRYNAQGLIQFLERLEAMQGREPSEFEQIFRTHPVTSERVRRAREHLEDLRAGRVEP